jgi:hypothetical protein
MHTYIHSKCCCNVRRCNTQLKCHIDVLAALLQLWACSTASTTCKAKSCKDLITVALVLTVMNVLCNACISTTCAAQLTQLQ